MLSTNNKKVLNAFRDLVIDSISKEEIVDLIKYFNDYYFNESNNYLVPLAQFIIEQHGGWGKLSCCYYEMRNFLKVALEETDEEANKYDDYDVANLYYHLVNKAIVSVFKLSTYLTRNKYKEFYLGYRLPF